MSDVLIVDDSTPSLIRRALEPFEYRLTFTNGGDEAIRQASQSTPDLLLIDLMLAGVELVEQFKQQFPHVRIILVTSEGSEAVAAKALRAGAATYVPKASLSYDLAQVVEHLLELVSRERARKQLLSQLRESQFVFEMNNDSGQVSSLVGYLQDSAAQMDVFDESELMQIGVALDEALTNALYHGNLELDSKLRENGPNEYFELADQRRQQKPYKDRRVYVRAHLLADRAQFVIRDEGPGFDVSRLPDPSDVENLDKASGRGVTLMRFFMDRVTYNERGNELTLVKHNGSETGLRVAGESPA